MGTPGEIGDSEIRRRVELFRTYRTIWHAADLLGEALLIGDERAAFEAATYIAANPKGALPLSLALAKRVLGVELIPHPIEDSWSAKLHRLKAFTSEHPLNAIAWMDLGLAYTIVGGSRQAEKSVRAAVHLGGGSRFVLRSAARFYVHGGDLERAHHLLVSTHVTKHDPWLLAAEVAIANSRNKSSRFLSIARRMADDTGIAPYDQSELTMALATSEFGFGAPQKRIRRLLRLSMIDPTENSVAQAEWLTSRNANLDGFDSLAMNLPYTFEARSGERFSRGEWSEAFGEALMWLEDQPFSARPAIAASFIANTLLDDQATAVEVSMRGIRPNPSDGTLLNNLAFSLASLNRTAEARKYVERASALRSSEPGLSTAITATRGLIAFREGDAQAGAALYAVALKEAEASRNTRQAQSAIVYLAQEELRAGTIGDAEALKRIEPVAKRPTDKVVAVVAKRALLSLGKKPKR